MSKSAQAPGPINYAQAAAAAKAKTASTANSTTQSNSTGPSTAVPTPLASPAPQSGNAQQLNGKHGATGSVSTAPAPSTTAANGAVAGAKINAAASDSSMIKSSFLADLRLPPSALQPTPQSLTNKELVRHQQKPLSPYRMALRKRPLRLQRLPARARLQQHRPRSTFTRCFKPLQVRLRQRRQLYLRRKTLHHRV